MDWMERIFHVDPDGGNGLFELAILVFLVVAVTMLVLRVRGRVTRRGAAAPREERRRQG
ncbi:MAG TPA: hypothetical protein VMU20_04525 [Candidatus Dormibacteraeota bacterium]|nr:hypothetical protein [Candidatus Dormibacteraeota bacterium]